MKKKIQVDTFKIQNFTTLQILSGDERILLQIYPYLVFICLVLNINVLHLSM